MLKSLFEGKETPTATARLICTAPLHVVLILKSLPFKVKLGYAICPRFGLEPARLPEVKIFLRHLPLCTLLI